jgi:hypothetical protein
MHSWLLHNFLFQSEFLVGLHGENPPPGYRQLMRAELTDAALRTRLVAAHQARGGWGLTKDPLEFDAHLVVAEGWLRINGEWVALAGSKFGSDNFTAFGVYSAMDSWFEVPWTTSPPAPDAIWTVSECANDSSKHPCLLVRVMEPSTSSFFATLNT